MTHIGGLWRLLAPALLCWACAAVLIHFPGSARWAMLIAAGCGVVTLCAVTLRASREHRRTEHPRTVFGVVLISCAVIVLVSARIDLEERVREQPVLAEASEASTPVSLNVAILEYPSSSVGISGEPRGWVRANIVRMESHGLSDKVPVILWLPRTAPESWAPGTSVSVTGSLERSPPQELVAYEVSVTEFETHAPVPNASLASQLATASAGLRTGLRDAASEQFGAELVPGFAVGDTALVSDELRELMQESSLTHLVAVSGANCALVVGACAAASAWLGFGRRLRAALAASGLAMFVIVVGPDASVQRASIMAAVLLVSGFGGKRGRALPSLGLAVLLLLVLNPWQSIQPGFALSVAATLGILLWTRGVEQWIRMVLRLPNVLALPLAVALVAQFTCAPLLLLLQPGLSLGGIVANVIAAPAAPVGTALGMLALLTLPVHPGIGALWVWGAAWPARWVEAAGHLAVSLPIHRLYWPGGWGGAALLAAVEALVCVACMLRSGKVTTARGRHLVELRPWSVRLAGPLSLRIVAQVTAAVIAGILVAVVAVVPLTARLGVPRDWAVVACDVGQGDALLLRDPHYPSEVMLVDTGDDPAKLTACLDLFGVGRVSLVVLTHDDRDHVGALGAVLSRCDAALMAPNSRDQDAARPIVKQLSRARVPVQMGAAGMTGGTASGLHWQIIGPAPDRTPVDTNAASLVLNVRVAGIRVLLLADTGADEQEWLTRTYPELGADVVKVAHHGSRDQSFGWYEQLGARVGIISVGENRYGHPNRGVIESLESAGTSVFTTEVLGSIALSMRDGASVEVWAGRGVSS